MILLTPSPGCRTPPLLLHQHHLRQVIGHSGYPIKNPASPLKTLRIPPREANCEAHQGEGNPDHHEQHHRGHLQQPSLCQIPLQTQPSRPQRKLLQRHRENSCTTCQDVQPCLPSSTSVSIGLTTSTQFNHFSKWLNPVYTVQPCLKVVELCLSSSTMSQSG